MAKKEKTVDESAGEKAKARAVELMKWYGIKKIWGCPEKSHWFTEESGAQRYERDKDVKCRVFEM